MADTVFVIILMVIEIITCAYIGDIFFDVIKNKVQSAVFLREILDIFIALKFKRNKRNIV